MNTGERTKVSSLMFISLLFISYTLKVFFLPHSRRPSLPLCLHLNVTLFIIPLDREGFAPKSGLLLSFRSWQSGSDESDSNLNNVPYLSDSQLRGMKSLIIVFAIISLKKVSHP